ncbi:hypothetical protein SPSYN_02604 [Sporotomaculum syntrophicum]|uniref:Uncharacterized protein n=1 Tax=Sporotomaculum syntrophicum TaxID=182264 RepID=A0A9D2WNE8_9FIRM|nr:hypothetical protein [Sporotomaculum syntrophicum]KAF1084200.1 hypothetical protein SPSYN_02604 [Sporotomaculum syntrophicum]
MLDRLQAVVKEHQHDNDLNFIKACHGVLTEIYPCLHLRWVHIYGKRWAYIYGNSGDLGQSSLRIQLSQDYGICIDNAKLVEPVELDQAMAIIKEHYNGKVMV